MRRVGHPRAYKIILTYSDRSTELAELARESFYGPNLPPSDNEEKHIMQSASERRGREINT